MYYCDMCGETTPQLHRYPNMQLVCYGCLGKHVIYNHPETDTIPVAALEAVIDELEVLRNSAENNFAIAQKERQQVEAQSDFATAAAFAQSIRRLNDLLTTKETTDE